MQPRLLAWVVAAAAAVAIAVALVPTLAEPARDNADANHMTIKEGLNGIAVGVRAWAERHGDGYPPASLVTRDGLATDAPDATIDEWPVNPYTGRPMALGTGPGDFAYRRVAAGASFELVAYDEDGELLIAIP